jgi:bifunctional DNA-binding transcriptional regulator/antitoxin component of YhaV-PrlF toxin-antitoxin module
MLSADPSKFITTCEEDEEGNLVLTFPDELLEAMGWGEGTCLDIDVIGNGIVLRAVERSNDSGEEATS